MLIIIQAEGWLHVGSILLSFYFCVCLKIPLIAGLADLANQNAGGSVTFEFQVNNE